MKNFPRLFSMSTLGIRQHQEFDYRFHGFRTDFVGDSGCGKSMVADLVQLVFVGSEVFHSGTESLDKREVDGMVLRSAAGRGTDMAFVLVNVEIAADRYVAIGAYLESSSKVSRSFIIQMGWDEENLSPLSRALEVQDIVLNGQIPTLELFKQAMEDRGFVYHGFPLRKRFHAYLFRHRLLSIDLSQSNKVLRDYAMIIQSFSRGKSLDIGNSASLKSFLFGDEKAREITEKYKKAVQELQTTLREYSQNRDEIELVKKKHKALKILREFRDNFEVDQQDYLIRQCAYCHQQALEAEEGFRESGREYCEGIGTLTAIREILKDQLLGEETVLGELHGSEAEAQKAYNKSYSEHSKLLPFLDLKVEYDCSADELGEIYRTYQTNKYRFELISGMEEKLLQENLQEVLADFLGLGEITAIVESVDAEVEAGASQRRQKEELLAFADINNEGSLGNWAIRNYRGYSLEVESVLMHYKNLPVAAPITGYDSYIPRPEMLLTGNFSFEKTDDGFWMMLGEVGQFVPYVEKQLFTGDNAEQLKLLLANMSQGLLREISELDQRVGLLKALKKFILANGGFAAYISVLSYRDELVGFVPEKGLEISRQDFEAGMVLLADSPRIVAEFNGADELWKEKRRVLGDYERFIAGVKRSQNELHNQLSGHVQQDIMETFFTHFPALRTDELSLSQELAYLRSSFSKASSRSAWIDSKVGDAQRKVRFIDINKQCENYEELKKATADAFKEARLVLASEPDISAWQAETIERPVEEEKRYIQSKIVFESKFREIVQEHASGDAYKFEVNLNYLELCTSVLPDAFLEESIEKDTSIEIIEQYLSRINEKNKNLNTRKLQKIREILDEVGDEVGKRQDTVRQIHNFLNHEEREITGGHRVTLRPDTINSYPKAWIDAYIEKLEQENTLFATGETLNELLRDSVSLEEKMINAFHAFGGHKGFKPKIEDLLNPNSYFNLTFKMESHATGKTNIGSTGQTYAAIALLCIARLSLVNKSSFNKKPPAGIRFMPIDEAEGLGSNFDLLYEIAREFDYQILTMGIKPLGKFREGEQYIYMLSNNKEAAEDVNYPPFAVFCDADQDFNL